jgi:DNA (cytosine-5)-methyltransferase 1
MIRGAYYNDNDPDAVAALRRLIAENVIASGDVDDRSIKDVRADDIRGYAQHHFFAGGGLWSVALRLAGWPDARPVWTASCPCQPISVAGKRRGRRDPRHLWPDLFRVLRAARSRGHGPAIVMGEQVSGALGYHWFDGVRADLATEGFASRVRDIPACAVDAPIERNRLYWIAVASSARQLGERTRLHQSRALEHGSPAGNGNGGCVAVAGAARDRRALSPRRLLAAVQELVSPGPAHDGSVGRPAGSRQQGLALAKRSEIIAPWRPDAQRADGGDGGQGAVVGAERDELSRQRMAELARQGAADADRTNGAIEAAAFGRNGSWWSAAEWIVCHDGKARRAKPGIPMLVDGLPGRVAAWRLVGNAISPVLAAEVIAAFLDVEGEAA